MNGSVAADRVSVFCDGTLTDPRLDHPEGVAVAPDGALWCGGEHGQLFRIAPDGGAFEEVATTRGFILGVAFGPDGALYACDLKHRAVFRYDPAADRLAAFASGDGTRSMAIPNMLAFDHANGLLYVSDSHDQHEAGPGIWRVDLERATTELWYDAPLRFANGIALTPTGDALYVAETFASRISRIPIGDDGRPGRAESVVDGIDRLPDGVAFDADGRLYIACYEPSRIYRHDGDRLELLVDDPEAHLLCHPTNIAFRGTELFAANLGRWHVTRIELDVPGHPLLPVETR